MRLLILFLIFIATSCKNDGASDNEEYIILNEHKIHAKTTGNGSPIIFAHGGYLDLEMWNPQIDQFRNTNQLIRFSDLGHGKTINSDKKLFGYEIINELTKRKPNDKFVLVGLSWGAMLCVDFALNYPDKVDKLILVSPGLSGWPYFKDSVALKNYNLRQEAIKNSDTLRAAKLFHQNWVIGPRRQPSELNKSFLSQSLHIITKTMKDHWLENWSELDTTKALTRLEQLQPRTYLIVGKNDAEDILLITNEYHRRVKNSKKIELDSVAHLLNMENPRRFNQVLKDILDE